MGGGGKRGMNYNLMTRMTQGDVYDVEKYGKLDRQT